MRYIKYILEGPKFFVFGLNKFLNINSKNIIPFFF